MVRRAFSTLLRALAEGEDPPALRIGIRTAPEALLDRSGEGLQTLSK